MQQRLWSSAWRRCGVREEGVCGGWGGRDGGEAARGPFYRTSKAAVMEWHTGREAGAEVTGRFGQV